ncbi:hypothetical protein AT03_17935 [Hafnia alvei FB1]|uniref:Uncharacterized protein n=1 Tax=Hafnia alvei FB1 TaxID=1453496 RepID=A0A097R5U2_HAFAL|nr:hypothetical protein AT03_17935 [Hafnia alvei FB1]
MTDSDRHNITGAFISTHRRGNFFTPGFTFTVSLLFCFPNACNCCLCMSGQRAHFTDHRFTFIKHALQFFFVIVCNGARVSSVIARGETTNTDGD